MNGKTTLYRDQWGNCWLASSVKHLREQIGGGKVSKMYVDKKDGTTVQTGYVVGRHWCTAYQRVEVAA